MNWNDIIITDKNDQVYKSDEARKFVETNCPDVTKTYQRGVFAVIKTTGKQKGKPTINPEAVKAILWQNLNTKVKSVVIDGRYFAAPVLKPLVPQKKQNNPINKVAQYSITLELGDLDALFEPINQPAEPWKDKGVQQRLQVLGYLYTPLLHPGNNAPDFHHSKACWEYYKGVHKVAADAEAIEKLKQEIRGNLITENFPESGKILAESKLPRENTFAAIRFPGGYCTTKSPVTGLRGGDHFFNKSVLSKVPDKYDFRIGDRRSDIEKIVFEENDLLGKFPLIAQVVAKWPDGRIEPVANVPVYFQLSKPDVLSNDNLFCAPVPPDQVMNYSLNPSAFNIWQENPPEIDSGQPRSFTPTPEDWAKAKRYAEQIVKEADQDSKAAVLQSEEEVRKAREELRLTQADWDEKNKALIEADKAYKTYEQNELSDLSTMFKETDKKRLKVEEEVTVLEGKIRALEFKIAPAPISKLVITYKTEEARENARKRAEENRLKKEALVKECREEIDKLRPDLETAKRELEVVNETRSKQQREYDEAAKKVSFKYPGKGDFEAVHAKKKEADIALTKAKTEEEAAEKKLKETRINPRTDLATQRLNEKNESENVKRAVKYILSEAATTNDQTAPIYRYLYANYPGPNVPSEISDAGQKRFINELLTKVKKEAQDDDPQSYNAPFKDYKGKSGRPVEGNIFEIQSRPRFTDGHLEWGALPLAAKGYEQYAVRAETNDKGYAGVIFMPVHCGGDTYKLRAFIDPEWLQKKSSGVVHKSGWETGTLVVWRNIRINRYLQMPNPMREFSPRLKETLKTGKHNPEINPQHNRMRLDTDVLRLSLLPKDPTEQKQYEAVDVEKVKENKIRYRPIPVSPTPLDQQLRWGYCELIADDSVVETLQQNEKEEAAALGLAALEKFWTNPKRVDWREVLYQDDTSPFLCNFLSFEQYKAVCVSKNAPDVWNPFEPTNEDEMTAIEKGLQWFYEAMMEHFARGGVLPGLTIVQIPRGDTWDLNACDVKTTITSGYGTGARGFYISHTDGVYHDVFHIYPSTSNAIHEIGHVLGLAHQPPAGADLEDAHQTPIKLPLTRPDVHQCVCVMSYSGCYGDLCGKCIMSLRGWAQTHTNNLYDN